MSKNLPANPLQSLIAQAAKQPPQPNASLARHEARHNSGGSGLVVVADVSASMADPAWGGRSKIALLREALAEVPERRALIAFHSAATIVAALPNPGGSTRLDLALDLAATLSPAETLVVSDGEPDDEGLASAAATRLGGIINALYIGPDDNKKAILFMMNLARRGCGRYYAHDLSKKQPIALGAATRQLLLK